MVLDRSDDIAGHSAAKGAVMLVTREGKMLAVCLVVVLSTLLFSSATWGQGISHTDVFFTYSSSRIAIAAQDDRMIIPQVMPESGFFAQSNNNPGFFSETDLQGGIGAQDIIVYNVLDDLIFWTDGEFTDPTGGATIRILNNPGFVEDTVVGANTGLQRGEFVPLANSIGQAVDGEFHAHVDFRLEPLAVAVEPELAPASGAYGLKISLSTDNESIAESDPFMIVFQYGIDDLVFEQALDDFESLLSMGGVPAVPGDFDADGLLTSADVDLLSMQVLSGKHDASFDLTGDSIVDSADHRRWVEDLAGSLFGDADLDFMVEFDDFLALSSGFGQSGGWANGDFDGDGSVGFPDFLALSANFGRAGSGMQDFAIATVPEPSACGWWIIMICLWVQRRRRCSRTIDTLP